MTDETSVGASSSAPIASGPVRPVWSLPSAVLVLGVMIGGQGVIAVVAGIAYALGLTGWAASGAILAALVAQYLVTAGAVLLVLKVRGAGLGANGLGFARFNVGGAIAFAVLATTLMRTVASLLTALLVAALQPAEPPTFVDPTAIFPSEAFGIAASAVVLGLLAPVVEESVFRGALLDALSRRFGFGWAVVASSAAFAVAHLNAWLMPGLFLLGAFLAWARKVTGSLWVPVVAHSAFNLGSLVLAYALKARGLA